MTVVEVLQQLLPQHVQWVDPKLHYTVAEARVNKGQCQILCNFEIKTFSKTLPEHYLLPSSLNSLPFHLRVAIRAFRSRNSRLSNVHG
jgi:hypothetical protein